MGAKGKDLTGRRFGRLVALEPTDGRCNGSVVWRCKCDCGNEAEVSAGQLSSGNTKSCGCLKLEHLSNPRPRKIRDLAGQRFGKLTVVGLCDERFNAQAVWRCRCDCGNEVDVPRGYLVSGVRTSCGCEKRNRPARRPRDIAGERFGKLTALCPTGERFHRGSVWACRCDCGVVEPVPRMYLSSGRVASCRFCRHSDGGRPKAKSDLAGKRFGRLAVLGDSGGRKGGEVLWLCRCDCGSVVERTTRSLNSSTNASCGCAGKDARAAAERRRQGGMAGKRFGRLVAIEPTEKRDHGAVVWRCRCDCGNECERSTRYMRVSPEPSCGCYEREASSGRGDRQVKDIAGQRFGRLTVVRPTDRRNRRGLRLWECRCDCGRTHYATAHNMKNGSTRSCGCLNDEMRRTITDAKVEGCGYYDGTSLRSLTASVPKSSTTGVKGVGKMKSGRFRAYISLEGKQRHLGCFDTLEEAAEARRRAEEEMYDPILKEHGWESTCEADWQETLKRAIGSAGK